jgi:ferric-dicitrate binding protein FerR (iron transport regulator)
VTSPRYAKLATELLSEQRPELVAPPSDDDRARAIAAIERAMHEERRHRTRRQVLIGTFAAAAGVLLVIGAARFLRHPLPVVANTAQPPRVTATAHAMGGAIVVEHEGRAGAVEDATAVAPGDRVSSAADGRAVLALSTGTHLVLEKASDLSVVEQASAQIYSLRAGAVRADVAKVPASGRFAIRTADTEVEVRGTSFRVSLVEPDPSCGGGTATRVDVTEGVVVVRNHGAEDRVAAGESWPRGCAKKPAPATTAIEPASTATASAPPSVALSAPPSAPKPTAAPTVAAVPASELAAQNDLFASATAAKRRGESASAIAGYEKFLAKYPGSALAESATVERMRLLAATDHARGAVAAKSYLARYPSGFARAEAESLAR